MILIGIAGKKRSGKDTLCQYIIDRVGEKYVARIALADALKEELAVAMDVSVDWINEHKDDLRGLLQSWGTDFRRNLCDKEYWTRKTFTKILQLHPQVKYVVITDVRFQSEADALRAVGANLIRLVSTRSPQDSHISETDLDTYTHFDYFIPNHSSLEELEKLATLTLNQINKRCHISPHLEHSLNRNNRYVLDSKAILIQEKLGQPLPSPNPPYSTLTGDSEPMSEEET